jgi:hypothetical protein
VNFIDQQIIASLHLTAVAQVDPANGKAGQRQQKQQPGLAYAHGRCPHQAVQEEGGSRTGQQGNQAGQ